MAAEVAAEPFLDLAKVRNVIKVAVREQEQLRRYTLGHEPFAGPVRGVEQDRPFGRFEQIAIGLKNPAAKAPVAHRRNSSRSR